MPETNTKAEKAKKSKEKQPVKPAKKGGGIFKRLIQYFRATAAELKKVIWPTPKQIINNTLIVIAMVIVVGIFIWLLDTLLTAGLGLIYVK